MVKNRLFGNKKIAKKVAKYFGDFEQKNCRQSISKIAKMGINRHIWSH